jgi:beta-glucanase (GH16 family)
MTQKLLIIGTFLCALVCCAQDPVFDNLVWFDEFDGNGAIDATKWHHQTQLPNGNSWYNGEVQHYTNRVENSYVENGSLFIKAIKENFTDQGVTKEYTSARLNSKFAFTYGRVEIRANLPSGVGTWPALWTLGKNITEPGGYWSGSHGTTSWPACGEIDIMEHWGNNQDFVQSALHTPSSFGNTINKGGRTIPGVSTEFYVYEMEWSAEKIVFKVDGITHYVYEPAVQNASTWPFDLEQYLLLNFAILPEIAASFTEDVLEVDYVRVYQESPLNVDETSPKPVIKTYPNPVKNNLSIVLPSELVGTQLRIYSIQGEVVLEKTLVTQTSQINLASYAKGVYLLKIETISGNFTQSILK